jgi:virginiamycin B lyase
MRVSLTLVAALAVWSGAAASSLAQDVQVFDVPAGAHPHDVAPGPNDLIWYTAQGQGALGVLDPSSGTVRQIPLGQGSRPHGVIQGPDGAAWITDSGLNAIVRVDPATEEVKVWRLPSTAANANLNTAAFDGNGTIWFTGQSGYYGRLVPATGAIEVFRAPGGRGPYGITATPSGDIWYASLAGNHIAQVDTATGQATVVQPATPGQGARRVWSDSTGRIWVAEWNAGQLTVHDPAANTWRSWHLPSGPGASPYAVYVDDTDMVWVSDFESDTVFRFDPERETFEPFANSASGGNVRQILGRPGAVFLPESGLDRIMVVFTGPTG